MTTERNAKSRAPGSDVDDILKRPGGLSYLVIPAADLRQSAEFYAAVLGWTVTGTDSKEPKFSDPSGHLIGRWILGQKFQREPGLLPYVYVDQIDNAVGRVASHGGEVVKAPHPEGNLRIATIRDPAGNLIGLWQDTKG